VSELLARCEQRLEVSASADDLTAVTRDLAALGEFAIDAADVSSVRYNVEWQARRLQTLADFAPRPLDADVVVYVAEHGDSDAKVVAQWHALVTGTIDIVRMPGDHYDPVIGEAKQRVAEDLDERLRRRVEVGMP
jgi:thioesterase domain-containing protein